MFLARGDFMEAILEKANELGRLIKETEIAKNYDDLYQKVELNKGAKEILENFTSFSNIISAKEKSAQPIEVWEKDKFQELAQKVSDSDLLRSFIDVQTEFMELMLRIQHSISGKTII
jgi:cell fate (sporulation/competence/biofilm development) regulator YlbF (YheA/YmcA/DUF963 family)